MAPPSANALAGTVDVYFSLKNPDDNRLAPGERVSVTVDLRTEGESLTVPWSAVIYDLFGGTWVYERTAERTYVRRRVEVRYVRDGVAVLASGPAADALVVTAGPAELFGTEVGFSK